MFISVIMAVHNGEEYLEESVKSILNQTYNNFEFIIVNDGSTDKTNKILQSISDPRIRTIHLEKNHGVAFARNLAVEQAKGDWIANQDGDDISLPNRLEEQIKYIQTHPETIAVCSLIQCISGNTPVDEQYLREREKYHNNIITHNQIERERFSNCPICCGTALFLKKAFIKVGGYDSTIPIGSDYDLIVMRMFNIGKVEVMPKILYQYRVNMKSITRQNEIETLNFINVVSLKGIRNICYPQLKRSPVIAVIGTHNGYRNFRDNVIPLTEFEVYDYFELSLLKAARQIIRLIRKNKIDGIIVLKNDSTETLLRFFLKDGKVKLNKNLFIIKNNVR
ncbi:glycosyltransferase family 2 protein [Bacillus cereus]|uniref:glycosyltransferase family 2 protein n=1 Tax=Bacillus cereus TaxID=1396 RepID=UPI00356ED7AD